MVVLKNPVKCYAIVIADQVLVWMLVTTHVYPAAVLHEHNHVQKFTLFHILFVGWHCLMMMLPCHDWSLMLFCCLIMSCYMLLFVLLDLVMDIGWWMCCCCLNLGSIQKFMWCVFGLLCLVLHNCYLPCCMWNAVGFYFDDLMKMHVGCC